MDEDRKTTGTIDLSGVLPGGGETSSHVFVVVLSGQKMGAIYRLGDGETIVGRASECDIALLDAGLSRRHAALVRTGQQVVVSDLGSTNGTFVRNERVGSAELSDGERFRLASTLLKVYFGDELDEAVQRELFEASSRDGLTGLHNRRYLDQRIGSEHSFSRRHGQPLSLLIFDVDGLSEINRELGFPAGDDVLRDVAAVLRAVTRAEDVVARFGGDELAVLARNTPMLPARGLADRARKYVKEHVVRTHGTELRVTVSVGVACFLAGGYAGPSELVEAAERALGLARAGGRDQVTLEEPPSRDRNPLKRTRPSHD